jgi:hypothetical protein
MKLLLILIRGAGFIVFSMCGCSTNPAVHSSNSRHSLNPQIETAIGAYWEMVSTYANRPREFDGYEWILKSFDDFSPLLGSNSPVDPETDSYDVYMKRMPDDCPIHSDLGTLENAYMAVLVLEEYFSNRKRFFEQNLSGNDDVILLAKSRSVGFLQAILEARQGEGSGRIQTREDMIYLSQKFGYSLLGMLWNGGKSLYGSESSTARRSSALENWLAN